MASRKVVIGVTVVLATLGAIITFVPMGCLRWRTPASQPLVLRFDVPEEIEEGVAPMRGFPFGGLRFDRPTVYDVEHAIRAAADDDQVRGLVLHIDGIDWGWAKIAEVRDAVRAFRKSGKPVQAVLTAGGERDYLLASAATHIYMPPSALLELDGLAASALFFRGALEKLGVSPNFEHVGAYKSAIEAYTRSDLSPPAREALDAVLTDDESLLVDTLSACRRMPPDSLRRLIDQGPYTAPEARAVGLIDSLMYSADVDSMALKRGNRRLVSMTLNRYIDRMPEGGLGAHIALVVASGAIMPGKSHDSAGDGRVMGSESVISDLQEARTRRSIRAVVLRVDSPGGSGQASDDIWREVARCRREKPVIVSMGDYAASGGYYISAGATDIVAQPATLTGSIGVFAGKFNIRGLLAKLGLSVDTVARGRHSEMLSPFSDFSDEERAVFQRHLQAFYDLFLRRVSSGRHMSVEAADSVGQGRVWTGLAGRDRGLVDRLGGIEDAIALAKKRAHISATENVVVDVLPRAHRDFFRDAIAGLWDQSDSDESLLSQIPGAARTWIA
ncbi:MAG: signal peptide peptidase SppA, partial [Candidatus Eiseniibacteriota bacterium]